MQGMPFLEHDDMDPAIHGPQLSAQRLPKIVNADSESVTGSVR